MCEPRKTKHKRCWFCGRRLRGNKGVSIDINGNTSEVHKYCADEYKKGNDCAFGMEY